MVGKHEKKDTLKEQNIDPKDYIITKDEEDTSPGGTYTAPGAAKCEDDDLVEVCHKNKGVFLYNALARVRERCQKKKIGINVGKKTTSGFLQRIKLAVFIMCTTNVKTPL